MYYNKIASGYNELHREEQRRKVAVIKKYLKITKKTKLLDVGCGTGISSDFNCDVTGIDPSRELIKQHPLYPKKAIEGQAEKLPFKDEEFDVVISVTAVHNFKDIKMGLKEIIRVGKNKFVITILKKSPKKENILIEINKLFDMKKEIEEEKDLILFLTKKTNI